MLNFRRSVDPTDLFCAILAAFNIDRLQASALLDYAQNHQLDPLHLAAARFGLSECAIYEQAAKQTGFAFVPTVPDGSLQLRQVDHPEHLRELRQIRAKIYDRDLLFAAPDFTRLLKLNERILVEPNLRRLICIVPPKAIRTALLTSQSPTLYDAATKRLARIWPMASAHLELGWLKRFAFLAAVLSVAALSAWSPDFLDLTVFIFMACLYLGTASFRLFCTIYGQFLPPPEKPDLLADEHLPVYTVLIPLRDESALVPQLAKSLRAINYPVEKLDIKFVIEDVSTRTMNAVLPFLDHLPFELVAVPDGMPRTKPKALNFALPFARGDYIVVFDAEDIPHPDQLRLAATKFALHPEIECFQAELLIDNAGETALTALFATEYAAQFGLIMPALAELQMPMPLGGTSNHFRLSALNLVGGWDSFNVTEDADLGLRMSRIHLRCAMLPSATREEAPVEIWPWIKQRTRWMKGWMQTLMVHSNDLGLLRTQLGWRNFVFFYFYIGGMVFAAPLHGIFVAKLIGEVIIYQGGLWERLLTAWPYFVVLGISYTCALITGLFGLWHIRKPYLAIFQCLLPLYWILTSIATLRAAWQLATNPFSWEKTTHGKTRVKRRQWQNTRGVRKRWLVRVRRVAVWLRLR